MEWLVTAQVLAVLNDQAYRQGDQSWVGRVWEFRWQQWLFSLGTIKSLGMLLCKDWDALVWLRVCVCR